MRTIRGGFLEDNQGFVNVWVDGSCLGNGRPNARAGFGIWYNVNHPMNVSERVRGRQTNNSGEIQAAIRAIWDCSGKSIQRLRINSDSDFLCKSVNERMSKWKKNGFHRWDGRPLLNRKDFMNLRDAIDQNGDMEIIFTHVRGHSGNRGNEQADLLARRGAGQIF